jgi:hypothetical protein
MGFNWAFKVLSKNDMDGTKGTYGERYTEHVDGNAEEKRALGRLRCMWEDNISINL